MNNSNLYEKLKSRERDKNLTQTKSESKSIIPQFAKY